MVPITIIPAATAAGSFLVYCTWSETNFLESLYSDWAESGAATVTDVVKSSVVADFLLLGQLISYDLNQATWSRIQDKAKRRDVVGSEGEFF